MSPWLILDRDGVINVDSDKYIKSPEEWKPIPGSIEAIAALCQSGFRIAIATNQSGIARGLFEVETLQQMHQKLNSLVEAHGGNIAGIFYCPHHPDDGCNCRKPKTGLLDEIERQFHLDLTGVPFIGDSQSDLDAAINKGCSPVLVRTGKGEKTLRKIHRDPKYVDLQIFDDLAAYARTMMIKH